MRQPALVILLVAAVGCQTGGDLPVCNLLSSDVRVDKLAAGDEVESEGTLLCVSQSGKVFVAWVDNRTGTDVIWLNSSTDGAKTFLGNAVQVNQGLEGAETPSHVYNPALACTDDQVYVAWEDDRDGELQNHNIYFNSSEDNGKTWREQDVALDNDPEGRYFSEVPVLSAVDDLVYVAWFSGDFGSFDIFLAASEDAGATWGLPVAVESDVPGSAYSANPSMVAQSDGTVFVAWEDSRNALTVDDGNDIYFAKSVNRGGSFSTDIRLDGGDDAGDHNSFTPQIAADGSNIYVVWFDGRNAQEADGPRDIYANYSADGGNNWQSNATIVEDAQGEYANQPGFFNSRFPVLAVKGNEAVVAWEDNRGIGYDIYARRMVDGAPEGAEARLDGGNLTTPSGFGQANSLRPQLSSSGSNVVVVWSDDRAVDDAASGFSDLYYNCTHDFGKTWDAEDKRVDNVTAGASFKVDVNVALIGETITAAWADGRDGSSDIWVHTMTKGEAADYVVDGDPDLCVREDPVDATTGGTTRTRE